KPLGSIARTASGAETTGKCMGCPDHKQARFGMLAVGSGCGRSRDPATVPGRLEPLAEGVANARRPNSAVACGPISRAGHALTRRSCRLPDAVNGDSNCSPLTNLRLGLGRHLSGDAAERVEKSQTRLVVQHFKLGAACFRAVQDDHFLDFEAVRFDSL